ncbi:RHS repeat-associated core domain-containing protein [Thermogutta sp.]|uniref:RHS repeat-associated core domain-containing protein n=1 Tax=Thermogutta sp. TaxID=1962930 RepID=UPI003C7B79DE
MCNTCAETNTGNPAVDSLFLFTARPFDPDTGLQNNLNRWYDARVGRWLSEDPIGFAGGDFNRYRYVQNSVLRGIDSLGLENFYVCGQPVRRQDCEGAVARVCGFTHVAIYGDKSGEIYDGWFGPNPRPTGTGLPHGKGVWCKKLHLVTEIVIPVPSTVPVPPIVRELKIEWGPPGVRGKSCHNATEADIIACLRAKPGRPRNSYPAFPGYLIENCQTDVYQAATGCCLGGYRPNTIVPGVPFTR